MPSLTRASGMVDSQVSSPAAANRAAQAGAPESRLCHALARRPVARFARHYGYNRAGVAGALMILLILIAALSANWLTPFVPFRAAGPPLLAPSMTHLMGTDDMGRDVFTNLLHGARTSLWVGITVAAMAAVVGTLLGATAGFFGGWVDDALMRLTELFQIMPRFFLAVIVIAFFGAGIEKIVLVLGLTSWTLIARILRAEVLSLRQRDFITATRAIGVRSRTVLWRHVLPNVVPSLVTTTALLVGQAILLEASLSFLGLGDPNVISWGMMLDKARAFLRTAWWTSFFPGLAITLTVLGLNLAADALNDLWNPALTRGVRR
jgi:peptide/nickel transport system permease protein